MKTQVMKYNEIQIGIAASSPVDTEVLILNDSAC